MWEIAVEIIEPIGAILGPTVSGLIISRQPPELCSLEKRVE